MVGGMLRQPYRGTMARAFRYATATRAFSAKASASGALYMCGTGESHKLGLGDTKDRETPVLVEALAGVPISHVACGKYHSVALSAAGDVYACGFGGSFFNGAGGLGHGDRKQLD